MIARVIVDIKHQSINQTFDYLIHEKDQLNIKKGMRVLVPFTDNNILRMGFVYDLVKTSSLANKYIEEVLDLAPIFTEELFLLLEALTTNPNELVAEAFETIIPKQLLMHYEKQATSIKPDQIPEDFKPFFKGQVWKLLKKDVVYYNRLKSLEQKGIIKLQTVLNTRDKKPLLTYVRLRDQSYVGTKKQNDTMDILRSHDKLLKQSLVEQSSISVVNTLIKNKVIDLFLEAEKLEVSNYNKETILPVLSKYNEKELTDLLAYKHHHVFVSAYNDSKLNPFFIHLINEFISKDKQVLILVPENFMIDSIKASLEFIFNSELIIDLRSGQTDKNYKLKHTAILNNDAKIIIGARSSVFTPFYELGLIAAIDSNNYSYKAHEGIYYDAIEIAKIRTKFLDIPLYLSSSALSLEHYEKVQSKTYKEINFEIHTQKNIELVDMRTELLKGNTKLVSEVLSKSIKSTLNHGNKVLLILNQKGYAPFVMCRTCSYVPMDPETQIPLRYDEKQGILKSNLTKYEEVFNRICSNCGKPTIKSVGSGIDQLISYLHKTYPSVRILKVDSDTITNKVFHEKITNLSDVDIIVGTQMALKSNLENKVDLIGILMIDQWLKLPKFDAYEKTFDLLRQAKHITAKDLIIQSYDPDNFVLKSIKGNTDAYYKEELGRRKIAKLPPIYKLLQLRIEGISYLKTYQYAYILKESLEKFGLVVLGPTASVLLKSQDKYRILLLIKYQGQMTDFNHLLKSSKEISIYMNHSVEWY